MGLANARFSTLLPLSYRSRFAALGQLNILALSPSSTFRGQGRDRKVRRIEDFAMVAVRTLYVSDAGTRRGPSIDNGTRACEGTSASATVSWMLRAGRELLQIRPSGGGLTEGFKAVSPKSYFWARNAPYPFSYLDNPFKSQQNGAPSERTSPTTSPNPIGVAGQASERSCATAALPIVYPMMTLSSSN